MPHIDPQSYSIFDIQVSEGVALVKFAGPDPTNIYSPLDQEEFVTLGRDVAEDDDILVVLITGRGNTFSAGLDRSGVHTAPPDFLATSHNTSVEFMRVWVDLDKPVVVALNGVALHQALTLAMLGDIVVAERSAAFRDVHVPLGLVSATGPFLWPPSMGLLRAKRYILTGEWLTAVEAERIGLVSEVVEDGAGLERAMEYANLLKAADEFAVRLTKRAMNQWLRPGREQVYEHALALEMLGIATRPPIDPPADYRTPPETIL
jgi:enoyl-CoA hydratase